MSFIYLKGLGLVKMLDYIKYLGIPASVSFTLACIFFGLQIIGEALEVKGRAVPEIMRISMKVRKHFAQKKKERETLSHMTEFLDDYRNTKNENNEMTATLTDVIGLLNDVKEHYSEDNITKRDGWMQSVNSKFEDIYAKQAERDELIISLNEKIDKNNADTLSLLIDNKRNYIIDFASKSADISCPVTREQYKRFFKVHKEYEEIIAENGMSNGEVDVAYRIAVESYEERLKSHSFIEDIRGY